MSPCPQVEKATIDHGEQYFLTSYDPTKELWISAKFTQPGGAEVSSELVERHAVLRTAVLGCRHRAAGLHCTTLHDIATVV